MIEFCITELLSEGITHIPTWSESQQNLAAGIQSDSSGVRTSVSGAAVAVAGSSYVSANMLSVVVSPSTPLMSRAVSDGSGSTMQLGALAGNITVDEGTGSRLIKLLSDRRRLQPTLLICQSDSNDR